MATPTRGTRRRSIVVASAAIALCGGAFFAFSQANGGTEAPTSKAQAEVRLVRTLKVRQQNDSESRVAIGDIRPERESDLGFRLAGKLVSRAVSVGDRVAKGALLARIEDEDYRNRLRSAKADQASAEAVVVEARASEGRIGTLLKKGYTTRANHDAALKNLRSAAAKLEAANAALDMAEDQLSYTELRADFDGIVTAVGAEDGQVVNVGQMVVRLADPSRKDAVFSIAEAAFGPSAPTEAVGIDVTLLSDSSVTAHGVVREVSPMADAATRTYQVKVAIADAPEAMRFGSSVSGCLSAAGTPVVVIPGSALFDTDGKPAVWVVGGDSAVSLKPIGVARYETDRVVVRDGLSAGDIIVTAGVNRLRAGQKVRLQNTGE